MAEFPTHGFVHRSCDAQNSGLCARAEVVAWCQKMDGIGGTSGSHWRGRKGKECHYLQEYMT